MPSHKKKSPAALLARKKAPKKIEKKLNPFEVRINKKKHDVLGQKSKSDKGLPGVARSKAMKKRKKTLLVEYKERNKSNQFVDRRFGEYNDDLSVEEKMMQRFTLQRKRKHERSSLFHLDDDNEEGLTHYGQSIGDMERFDHIELSDDEAEEEDISETHFGGFLKKKKLDNDEPAEKDERPKTRKEIMDEVVAKSKAAKYKQQSERQGVEELMDKVNMEWKSLQSVLPKSGDSEPPSRGGDDYDRTVRELAFERRGQPTDRMKTEEEIAREEKERLEKLEADRVRRMRGHVTSGDDLVIESADYICDRPTSKKKVQFTVHYKDGKIVLPQDGGEGWALGREDGDSGEGVESEDGDSSDGGDGVESEDGDSGEGVESEDGDSGEDGDGVESEDGDPGVGYGSDLDSEEESNDEADNKRSKVKQPIFKGRSQAQMQKMKEIAAKELPYMFTVPKTLEDLQTIVADRSPEECLTAVERIHTCNHPSINPTNKQKLEMFLPVVLDYCSSLAEEGGMERILTLDKMARPLYKLSQLNPRHMAHEFRNRLEESRDMWLTEYKGKRYLPFSKLILFKLIGAIFPTSDYEHPVTTPSLVLMGQLLAKCQVKSLSDVLAGLFLCELVIEYLSLSKRFIPEVVNFLTSVVGCFVSGEKGILLPPFTSISDSLMMLAREDSHREDCEDVPILISMIANRADLHDNQDLQTTGCGVLKSALLSLSQLVELYSDLPSFSEIFSPVTTNLEGVLKRNRPPEIQHSVKETLTGIASRGCKSKGVLQLLKQKPKSIKFYEPKFDEVYEVTRKKSRSKTDGEKQKIKHKVKKETKGAMREIRRDGAFLAKEKISETMQRDAERAAKTKMILHDLQMGQHEVKEERRKRRK